jgi:hypothetical protein
VQILTQQRMQVLNSEDRRELRSFFLQPQMMTRAECSDEGAKMVLAMAIHECCCAPADALAGRCCCSDVLVQKYKC